MCCGRSISLNFALEIAAKWSAVICLLERFDLVQLLFGFVIIQQQNYHLQRQQKEKYERQNKNDSKIISNKKIMNKDHTIITRFWVESVFVISHLLIFV